MQISLGTRFAVAETSSGLEANSVQELVNFLQNNGYLAVTRIAQSIIPVSSNGVVETDLQSLTLPAGTFANLGDTVHVNGGFAVAASVGQPVVKFYIDGNVAVNATGIQLAITGAYANFQLVRTGAGELTISGIIPGVTGGGPGSSASGFIFCEVISGLSFDAAIDIKFTGQATDAADTVTQRTMFADLTLAK